MELPRRQGSHHPTIKCSSCAVDLPLNAIANHICAISQHRLPSESYHEQTPMLVPQPSLDGHHYLESLPLRNHRPVLPKLDSSITSRSGLRPSEAASIAHDLGLPSPTGAGPLSHKSPHRSRSKPRKPLIVRPPSPEGPVSQDCAFPPFPLKPKKSPAEKDAKRHRAQSTSRSTTSTKTYQHSSSQSTASSVYSTSSGPAKSRASNTSSGHRSKATIDESVALPPPSPNSPVHTNHSLYSMGLSPDRHEGLPGLVPSDSYTSSAPSSSISTMPPTPSWPPDRSEPSPKFVQSNSDLGWTPVEESIQEERTLKMTHDREEKHNPNHLETFDKILTPDQLRIGAPTFDNPPREPFRRNKRPAPLLPTKQLSPAEYAMPLSARLPPPPPPPPQPSTGGLSRTLTNLFGRKRSKSTAAANLPLPTFDSPRMRALAPEPPERPPRGDSLWDEVTPTALSESKPSPLPSPVPSPRNDHIEDMKLLEERAPSDEKPQRNKVRETGEFNFDFTNLEKSSTPDSVDLLPEAVKASHDVSALVEAAPVVSVSQQGMPESDLHRASMDSASSYGSIGFSTNRRTSSKSSVPSSEISSRLNPVPSVDIEQQPPPTIPAATSMTTMTTTAARPSTLEIPVPLVVPMEMLVPESPTDPLYQGGKLSPVPESELLSSVSSIETEHVVAPFRPSPPPRSSTRGSSRSGRSENSTGIKGKCRACSKFIVSGQKSIASADGRLTGKYHKECFACRTCKEPFATADFYVFKDQPYCAHHYHALNNTLCNGCGKGIEGQYFDISDDPTNMSKKFHPKCLQCATCKVQLNEDYFEFHGRIYCERDAFRAANGPKSPYDTVPSRPSPLVREIVSIEEVGLKGRFPERRTTKLLMT